MNEPTAASRPRANSTYVSMWLALDPMTGEPALVDLVLLANQDISQVHFSPPEISF